LVSMTCGTVATVHRLVYSPAVRSDEVVRPAPRAAEDGQDESAANASQFGAVATGSTRTAFGERTPAGHRSSTTRPVAAGASPSPASLAPNGPPEADSVRPATTSEATEPSAAWMPHMTAASLAAALLAVGWTLLAPLGCLAVGYVVLRRQLAPLADVECQLRSIALEDAEQNIQLAPVQVHDAMTRGWNRL